MQTDFECDRAIVGMAGIAVPCIKFIATVDFLPECVSRFRAATSFSSISFYRGNPPPPPLAVKRPDIPARTIVLAAIKLRHQKKAISISSNGIDLHTMTGGRREGGGKMQRYRGVVAASSWLCGTQGHRRVVGRSRIRRRGRMTKLRFRNEKSFGHSFVDLSCRRESCTKSREQDKVSFRGNF